MVPLPADVALVVGVLVTAGAVVQDVLHTMTEAASVLALHSNNSSMQLDLEGFAMFMSRFMAAAGYDLDDVLDQLITLAATKVREGWHCQDSARPGCPLATSTRPLMKSQPLKCLKAGM
jgi:hypothetical protein